MKPTQINWPTPPGWVQSVNSSRLHFGSKNASSPLSCRLRTLRARSWRMGSGNWVGSGSWSSAASTLPDLAFELWNIAYLILQHLSCLLCLIFGGCIGLAWPPLTKFPSSHCLHSLLPALCAQSIRLPTYSQELCPFLKSKLAWLSNSNAWYFLWATQIQDWFIL